MSNLTDKEKSYIAGVIDSDGCIRIKKSTYGLRKRPDVKSPTYSEFIQVRQKGKLIPEFFKRHFGGAFWQESRIQSGKNYKMWTWTVTNRQASIFLKEILPFLKLKKKQAELCLELRKSKESKEARWRGGRKQRRVMSKSVLEKREKLFQKVKEVNGWNWMKARGLSTK